MLVELKSIGLPEKAAIVYEALLELGLAFPSKVAEVTKLNRSTVYKILSDLALRGLVSQIERKNKLCYQIEQPAKLVGFAKHQIALAEERFERAKQILPELEGLFSLVPNKPRVRFFEGIEGVLAVYNEHIQEERPYEMLSYSNVEALLKALPPAFVTKYVKQKAKLGITTRAIFPDSVFSKEYDDRVYANAPKSIRVERKYVPAEVFPFQADVTLYGTNKVSIVNFRKGVYIGVIIEDETIAGLLRMSFELAWRGMEKRA